MEWYTLHLGVSYQKCYNHVQSFDLILDRDYNMEFTSYEKANYKYRISVVSYTRN